MVGLIPAYAGRTNLNFAAISHRPAHPRLRGADQLGQDSQGRNLGSSPLTRGGQARHLRVLQRGGLIPAYAGRTGVCTGRNQGRWAHPRLRGADWSTWSRSLVLMGSSPLTRGGRFSAQGRRARTGLIPAYAGRTTQPWMR